MRGKFISVESVWRGDISITGTYRRTLRGGYRSTRVRMHICISKTGDRGRFLPDGNIQFLGRKDDQVKLRGQRIELGEIETTLARHPVVHQAVVTVREDRPGDQRLVAYLVLRPEAEPSTAVTRIRTFLQEWLPEYMVPSAWKFLETLPLTPSGKVHRKSLPAPDDAIAAERDDKAPSTEVQRTLASIWCSALGVARVGIQGNFFELGGHSLLAMRAVLEIRKQLAVNIPLRTFFENPTLGQPGRSARRRKAAAPAARIDANSARSTPTSVFRRAALNSANMSPDVQCITCRWSTSMVA